MDGERGDQGARVAAVTIFLARPEPIGEGIPLAVKDLFDTAGLRTTYGSILFADHVPERTAEAVSRLEAAGYVSVGKTSLHEFAYGITSYNPHFGDVANPLSRILTQLPHSAMITSLRRESSGGQSTVLCGWPSARGRASARRP
jgi:Asp-tRNA(Asn)/Glu-tRNA(Gln) amidotransferase A subunit family amidase